MLTNATYLSVHDMYRSRRDETFGIMPDGYTIYTRAWDLLYTLSIFYKAIHTGNIFPILCLNLKFLTL